MNKHILIDYEEAECTTHGLEGPCHIPTCRRDANGYAILWDGECSQRVHRYCFSKEFGEVPRGVVVGHLCRRRDCCNEKHLRLETRRQSALENNFGPTAINNSKTHCKNGHEFTAENTRIRNGVKRNCRKCERKRKSEYYKRNPELRRAKEKRKRERRNARQ